MEVYGCKKKKNSEAFKKKVVKFTILVGKVVVKNQLFLYSIEGDGYWFLKKKEQRTFEEKVVKFTILVVKVVVKKQ